MEVWRRLHPGADLQLLPFDVWRGVLLRRRKGQPMDHGEPLTPLRAYAHDVPRYYMQNFGTAVSHPNTRFYSAFMQDTIRVSRSFTLNVGIRYDLQTFEPGPLA